MEKGRKKWQLEGKWFWGLISKWTSSKNKQTTQKKWSVLRHAKMHACYIPLANFLPQILSTVVCNPMSSALVDCSCCQLVSICICLTSSLRWRCYVCLWRVCTWATGDCWSYDDRVLIWGCCQRAPKLLGELKVVQFELGFSLFIYLFFSKLKRRVNFV